MNENLNNNNPLSSWIRPSLAIAFGIVLAFMLAIGFKVAIATGNWELAVGLLAVAAVPPFWYFNIRSGDKVTEKLLTMFKLGGTLTSQGSQGTAAAAASTETASPPSPSPAAPPAAPVVEALPEPLDVQAFHKQVLVSVVPRYNETNPATIFQEAKDKGSVSPCANIGQAQAYWDYMVPLAYAAEAYVKEVEEKKLAAAGGCKGVVSPEYVFWQQELAKTLKFRDDVYTLARANIDWKMSLGQNATLYLVGVWANQLIKAAWEA